VTQKRSFLGPEENATFESLEQILRPLGARVHAKTRLEDALGALNIQLRNLPFQRHVIEYGLRSHLDFFVELDDPRAHIAFEFDGAFHNSDQTTRRNDAWKDDLCRAAGLNVVRIDGTGFQVFEEYNLVGWLADCWVMDEHFNARVANGDLPYDAFFMPAFVLSDPAKPGVKSPMDPFLRRRAQHQAAAELGLCAWPCEEWQPVSQNDGNIVAVAIAYQDETSAALGVSHLKPFSIAGMSAFNICGEIAMWKAVGRLNDMRVNNAAPDPEPVLSRWRETMRRLGSVRRMQPRFLNSTD
jgi:very-short-patch-repair endonuclease